MNAPLQVELRDCTNLTKGKPPAQQPYYGADSARYLTPEYLRGSATCESAKPSSNAVYIKDGETILLWDGSNAGEVFLGREGILASTMTLVSPDSRFTPDYFFFALKRWESFLKGQTSGSGIPHVDKEVLEKLEITEFAEPEQSKIAEVLSTVDRAIAQTEALIAKQQRIKTGLMQDLLTRGIDQDGQLRSEATHAFKDSPLGRIPVEWEVIDFGDAGQWFSGGTPSKTNDLFWNGGVPWVCPKDMKQLELTSSIETITDYAVTAGVRLMPAGTVFIVIRGMILAHTFPVGYATCAMAFNQDMKAIIAKEGLSGRYLAYWLMSQPHEFLKLTTTATHGTKRFDMDELSAVAMRLPDLGEQEAILRILDRQQSLINGAQDRAEKLQHLKTALMQDLLTGKVRVTPLLQQAEEAVSA